MDYTVSKYNINTAKWETVQPKERILVETIIVTPELATMFLENNNHNRNLMTNLVTKYARDMNAGKWGISDSAILISNEKNVYNGQHRLWAVIESNTTQTFLIMWGATIEDQANTDGGRNRKLFDVATLNGLKIDRFATATGRYIRRQTIEYIPRQATREEEVEFLVRHKEGLDWATRIFKPIDLKKIDKAPTAIKGSDIAAAFVRAWYYYAKEPEKQARVELMANGLIRSSVYDQLIAHKNDGDGAFYRLVSYIATHIGQGQASRNDRYSKVEKAILLFVNNENRQALIASPYEIFLLPVEMEAKIINKFNMKATKELIESAEKKVEEKI